MNNNRKKQNQPWAAIVVIVAGTLLALLENVDLDAVLNGRLLLIAAAAILGAGAIAFLAVRLIKNAASMADGDNSYTKDASGVSVAKKASGSSYTRARAQEHAQRNAAKPKCDYGDANCQYSHDQQRRLQQLDSFLKNGLIEKEEYKIMREKYLRSQ